MFLFVITQYFGFNQITILIIIIFYIHVCPQLALKRLNENIILNSSGWYFQTDRFPSINTFQLFVYIPRNIFLSQDRKQDRHKSEATASSCTVSVNIIGFRVIPTPRRMPCHFSHKSESGRIYVFARAAPPVARPVLNKPRNGFIKFPNKLVYNAPFG